MYFKQLVFLLSVSNKLLGIQLNYLEYAAFVPVISFSSLSLKPIVG